MKKIIRKNQLIITALALMIAVAGYFSYMNQDMDDKKIMAQADEDDNVAAGESYEISDEDLMQQEIFTAEEPDGSKEEQAEQTISEDVASSGTDTEENLNPGEAVLTSTTVGNLDYASEMKLSREQVRSKNKEALMEIVNNNSISEEQKQDAINKMIAITDIAERENAAEMLLEAKGFTDVVVSITEENCDVVLNMGEVTDAKRAQVEDIVKRKTKVPAENIIITPIVIGETENK